ncbi:hypothetical protein NG798_27505, partial [Ancylothrix sp. C2]|uniref:hypothetical protein n=1 Tax=Ancylothrix sp. D3o TaxID=2953691 RepID=UPI0021BB102C
ADVQLLDVLDKLVPVLNGRIFQTGRCHHSIIGYFKQVGAGVQWWDILKRPVSPLNGRIF